MNMRKFSNHKFAQIKPKYQKQGKRWIRLIPFEGHEEGAGLFYYYDLSEPCLYDDWCESLEMALDRAREFYGIEESEWKSAEELTLSGITIIDEE